MNYADRVKQRIKKNVLTLQKENIQEKRASAIIFDNISDNFKADTYESIKKNPDWDKRLNKPHSQVPPALEVQSSNSSDALLMNFFCNPKFTEWKGPKIIFKVDEFDFFEFGWNPNFINENNPYRTEIDLKFNDIIIEAKLTEADFQVKNKEVVERYENLEIVFDKDLLPVNSNGNYLTYQLIRNILTAHKYNYRFILLVDESRIDLIRDFYQTTLAIKDNDLKRKIEFITWQELASKVGKELREYISSKYF